MAVYVCDKCDFRFTRVGEVAGCERCGNTKIRFATEEEAAKYRPEKAEPYKVPVKANA